MEGKAQKASLLGSIVTSLIASACCIGPVVFAFLGVSSAGFLTEMEPYRAVITVFTLLLLGIAFYFTYKKKPASECEESSYCANPKSDTWNKRILWISTVLIIVFLTFPCWSVYLV